MSRTTVALLCWPSSRSRLGYFRQTLASLRGLLRGDFEIQVFGESESDALFLEECEAVCQRQGVDVWWRRGEPNQGNNLNYALDSCNTDYVFLMDDDCVLQMELDLDKAVRLMEEEPLVQLVFYPSSGPQRNEYFRCAAMTVGDNIIWGLVSHTNRYILHSSGILIRRDFVEKYGKYVENQKHGRPEEDMNARLKERGAVVAIPPGLTYFRHIGEIRANGTAC